VSVLAALSTITDLPREESQVRSIRPTVDRPPGAVTSLDGDDYFLLQAEMSDQNLLAGRSRRGHMRQDGRGLRSLTHVERLDAAARLRWSIQQDPDPQDMLVARHCTWIRATNGTAVLRAGHTIRWRPAPRPGREWKESSNAPGRHGGAFATPTIARCVAAGCHERTGSWYVTDWARPSMSVPSGGSADRRSGKARRGVAQAREVKNLLLRACSRRTLSYHRRRSRWRPCELPGCLELHERVVAQSGFSIKS
jgi:hypothetical protein